MNWTVLWSRLKALEGKVDSLELISFETVTELPETGEPNIIYLVPKSDPETGNYSDEYIWDSDSQTYEKIGDTMVSPLPEVSAADNGKVLGVINGIWDKFSLDLNTIKFFNVVTSGSYVKLSDGGNLSVIVDAYNNGYLPVLKYTELNELLIPLFISSGNMCFISSNTSPVTLEIPGGFINYIPLRCYTKQNNSTLKKITTNLDALQASIRDNSLRNTVAANNFVQNGNYSIGDLVTHFGILYKCKKSGYKSGWNSSEWEAITLPGLINGSVPTDYTKDTSVTALYDSTATYELGDIVMYNKELYKCTTAILVAEEWDSTHWIKTDIFSQMPSGGGALSALSDVDLTNPSDEQDLVYSATLGKWINKTKVVTLTKAQYDLLPSSKLTDGIMYYITDLDINDYAKDSSIADLYDNTSTYAVGDIVMFENELYKCTTAVSVAEDFDVNKWTLINVMDIISASITSVLNTSF